jgi:ADP-heptose:LPS heptosyltransferase
LVNPEWAPVVRGSPVVDQVWEFPRASFRGPLGPLRLLRWGAQFGAQNPADVVLDFQGLLRSAWVGKCARRGQFAGLADAREGARFFYDRSVSVAGRRHAVDRYLALVENFGAQPETRGALEWPFPAAELPREARSAPWIGEPFIALHPFSRGKGKSLTLPQVQSLCEALAPVPIVLLGRSMDQIPAMGHVVNFLNRTSLLEMLGLLRAAAWTVSVDSGPMHMAAALSSRVVAVHTWSDPDRVGPYPLDAWVLKDGRLATRRDWSRGGGSRVIGMEALARWIRQRL